MLRDRMQRWLKNRAVVALKNRRQPCIEALEDRLTPAGGFVGDPALYQVLPEAPVLSRLARFVPSAIPALSNWETVAAGDTHLDPNLNGSHTNIYVIAHGWAPGFKDMVTANGTATDPLKWWQTLDTSLTNSPGGPASPEMFYASAGNGTQISPTGLAYALTQADPKAIVLAYSWIDESATDQFLGAIPEDSYLSEAFTAMNGKRLANALEQALPTDFNAHGGKLHLIGHSHGSKVATLATLALKQTANTNFHVSQLTILDSPEVSSRLVRDGDAANNLWFYLGGLDISHVSPTATQTFVDHYISEFDNPIGNIQGVNPFNTSQTNTALQQVVDVTLNGNVLYNLTDLGNLHAYAFNWYGGGSLPWAQNPTPTVADQWSPLINTANLPTAGSYKQKWQAATQNQFELTTGPTNNSVAFTPVFTDVSFLSSSVTAGSSFNSATGQITLTEDGSSTATFIGKFTPESGLNGVSFQYEFTNVGQGDQLVISVDTTATFGYDIYFVMTGTVAGTTKGVGTLSLTSIAGAYFNHDIKIELKPLNGSSGASVKIGNMQQFTTTKAGLPILDASTAGSHAVVEGKATGNRVLATFTDPDVNAVAGDFQTLVDWGGDVHGTPTVTLVKIGSGAGGSTWQVIGNAIYLNKGTYPVNVTVRDLKSGTRISTSAAGQKTFLVANVPLTDMSPVRRRKVLGGKSTGQVVVATFRDGNRFAPLSGYTVTINWGDGTSSVGTVVLVSRTASGSNWKVIGSHTYAKPKALWAFRTVTVTIVDAAGQTIKSRRTGFLVFRDVILPFVN